MVHSGNLIKHLINAINCAINSCSKHAVSSSSSFSAETACHWFCCCWFFFCIINKYAYTFLIKNLFIQVYSPSWSVSFCVALAINILFSMWLNLHPFTSSLNVHMHFPAWTHTRTYVFPCARERCSSIKPVSKWAIALGSHSRPRTAGAKIRGG